VYALLYLHTFIYNVICFEHTMMSAMAHFIWASFWKGYKSKKRTSTSLL